ncbi:hypothetical protein SDC9_166318 [bioreactor metagenome]|uniref:Uncharacterized protein n=1 Tax=bioreactor metagenome TaxID=1076179 RepID=A0A645G4K4_9ZZZZ
MISHAAGCLGRKFNTLRPHFANHTAPQGVVKVQHKAFFIFTQQAFNNVGDIVAQFRDVLHRHRVLIQVPF